MLLYTDTWNKIYVKTGYILVSRDGKKIKASCSIEDIPTKYLKKISHEYRVDGLCYYTSYEDLDLMWSVKRIYVKCN